MWISERTGFGGGAVPCVSGSQVSGLRVHATAVTSLSRGPYSIGVRGSTPRPAWTGDAFGDQIDVTWADSMVSAMMAGAGAMIVWAGLSVDTGCPLILGLTQRNGGSCSTERGLSRSAREGPR
jgi:hypothetical protein